MKVFNWIKSFFISSNENIQASNDYASIICDPPYSLLTQSSLSIEDIHRIQNIIEFYGNDFKESNDKNETIQNAYSELISISSEDENLRLYIHELIFYTSIRMINAIFYVELSKIILLNHPQQLSFIKSQIFWCFDNFADLFIYLLISEKILEEKDLKPFEKALIFDMSFYFTTDSNNYNPFYSNMRFLYLLDQEKVNFHYSFLESFYEQVKLDLKKTDYKKTMRYCLNMNETAIAIREDNEEAIDSNNGRIELNLIDRNEMTMFGCSFLQYAAFYHSKKCFKKLATTKNLEEEKKYQTDKSKKCYYLANKYVLSDYAACGGDIEICKFLLENGIEFTSQSLCCAIHYHRLEVFNWLINEIKIEMDEKCIKTSFQYEFIPAIKMCNLEIDVNFELSKSGNYVLFINFIKKNFSIPNIKKYKYESLFPIFLYNSVDCIRFILGKKLDLNECCWFDSSNLRFENSVKQYRNPFHIAIKHQFFDLLKMILSYGSIDLNKNEVLISSGGLATLGFSAVKKLTPLEISIYTDNKDMVNILLSIEQIDVNHLCYSCYTYGHSNYKNNLSIFYAAALHENVEILDDLLKSNRINKNVKSQSKMIDKGYSVNRNIEFDVDILKNVKNKKVFDVLSKYGIE